MDPYLEHRWGDVHSRLCVMLSAALQPALPKDLRARTEEDVLLEDDDEDGLRLFRPDAVVVQTKAPRGSRPAASTSSSAVAEETILDFSLYVPTDRWVQIIDMAAGNRVVTAIEILSPSNKAAGRTNERYRQKLLKYMAAGVNVVEIDLLRSRRANLLFVDVPPGSDPATSYFTCIWRATQASHIGLIEIGLREPLPTIPIPCRESDPEVPLLLQPLIDRIYIEGGHDDIDYGKPLDPPLSPDDAQWFAKLRADITPA